MKNVGGDEWVVIVKSVLMNDYQYGTTLDYGNGTYSILVVPEVAGPNDLSITLDGKHIRGSPFRINVVHNAVHGPSSFVVDEAEVSQMKAMTENIFTIQAVDKLGNKAIYSQEHPHNTSVSVESESIDTSATQISYGGGGKYEISVKPVVSGEIYIEIMLNGKDIIGSPPPVSVQPGDFFADTSVATGVGLMRAQAGVQASFSIQSKDAGGNDKVQDDAMFNVTLTLVERPKAPFGIEMYSTNSTNEVVVTGTQSFIEEGQYLIQYTCFEAGQYDLMIKDFHGNSIAGSPFSVHVAPGQLSGTQSIMTGDGILKGIAGHISPVLVFPRDAYQNILDGQEILELEIDVTLKSRHQSKWEEDDNNLVGEHNTKQLVGASSDGSFHLDYVTVYAGVYSLNVVTFLPGGLKASYYSSPDFATEHLVFSSIEAKVDKDFGSLSTCQNNEDNTCGSLSDMAGPLNIGAKWIGKLKADVTESYEIRVDCNDGGHASIAIDGVDVMPWQPCWPYALISTVLTAKRVDFVLRYKNYEGNDPFVTLKWSSPSIGGLAAIPSSNLFYEETIGDTFFPDIYPDSAYAPLSNAIGDSLRHAVSGVEQVFQVETRDIHGNLLLSGGVEVGVYSDDATIETWVVDNRNGTYSVHYIADASGEYILSVQVGELSIKDSPFLLTVRPNRSHPQTSILSMDDDGFVVAGRPLLSRLQTRDSYGNIRYQGGDKVTANLFAVETPSERYGCQVDDDDNGTYLIECPSQWKKGSYLLDVSIESSNGVPEPLESGPFDVTVFAGQAVASTTSVFSNASLTTEYSSVPSVHIVGDAGTWGSFVVSTRDMFGNYLTTGNNHFVARVAGDDVAEVQVIDQENGEYIVAYIVNKASAYTIDVGMVTGSGLVGSYYLNETSLIDGLPRVTLIDEGIDFDAWNLGESFSHARWTGFIKFPHNGKFELEMTGIEGNCTLLIGSKLVVDSRHGSSIGSFVAMENVLYELDIEYSMEISRLLLKLYWTSAEISKQIVPGSHYFNATEPIHGSPFHLTIL